MQFFSTSETDHRASQDFSTPVAADGVLAFMVRDALAYGLVELMVVLDSRKPCAALQQHFDEDR